MTGPSKTTRALVYARAGERCELCGESAEGGSVHHRRPRGMGGTKDPARNAASNLLLLCGSGTTRCHGWVESHREHATFLGVLIPMSSATPATEIPVALHHGIGSVWLTDDGGYSFAPPEPT